MKSPRQIRLGAFLLLATGVGCIAGLAGRSYVKYRQEQAESAELTKLRTAVYELGGKMTTSSFVDIWWVWLLFEKPPRTAKVEFDRTRGAGLDSKDPAAAKKLRGVIGNPAVRSLTFSRTDFTPAGLDNTETSPNLQRFSVYSDYPISGEFIFRKFPNLESLRLGGPIATDSWMWRELSSRNKVKSIHLGTPISQEAWDALIDLPLTYLSVSASSVLVAGATKDWERQYFPSSPPRVHFHGRMADTLHELTIGDRIVDAADLIPLTEYKQLTYVHVNVSTSLDPVIEALLRRSLRGTQIRLDRVDPSTHPY